MSVRVILGTMTFSKDGGCGQVQTDQVTKILQALVATQQAYINMPNDTAHSKVLVDTARIYQCSTPECDTETVLGDVFAANPELLKKCSIATKCNAAIEPWKSLSKESVIAQCEESLKKLQVNCVDLFYLHSPDIQTPVEETLAGVDWLYKKKKIKEFGLSNYPAWKVVDIYWRCKNMGTVLPTVYQGMYNGITRDFEREVVPVLREFGMRCYMYNPLAGGLLTGRYGNLEEMKQQTKGRFSEEFDKAFGQGLRAGAMYQARFGKEELFQGLEFLRETCDAASIPMANAALRWCLFHSLLSGDHGDGMIFGVSSHTQLTANLKACSEGPLPAAVVQAFDKAWEVARPVCESYFRGYGPTPGSISKHLAMYSKGNLRASPY